MGRRTGSQVGRRTLISLRDAADLVGGVHPRTIHRWVKDGRLEGFRVGPKILRVDRDEVLAMIRPMDEVGA